MLPHRMNSFWTLLVSLLVQKAALKLVWQTSPLKVFKDVKCLDDIQDVVPMIEIESILVITRTTTIVGQCEQYFMGAIGILAKIFCLDMLRHPTVLVLNSEQLDKGKMVREVKPTSEFTQIGQTCKHRAVLEAERRWCGNESEDGLNDEPPIWSNDQMAAAVLDVRVVAQIAKCTNDHAACLTHFYEQVFEPEWMIRYGVADDELTEPEDNDDDFGLYGLEDDSAVKEDDATRCKRDYNSWMRNWITLSKRVVEQMNNTPLTTTTAVTTANAPDAEANANPDAEGPAASADAEVSAASTDAEAPAASINVDVDVASHLEVPITEKEAELWRLIKFDIAPFMLAAESHVMHRGHLMYGFLPALARRYLGRLQSESYCERVISFLGQVANDRTVAAKAKTIGNRVVVHMNKVHAERHGTL